MAFSFLEYCFFSVLEIFMLLCSANEESGDIIGGSTKQHNTQSRISLETLKQCYSNLVPEMYITKERK